MPTFRTNYPAGHIVPSGSTLNGIGSAINQLLPALSASRRNFNGLGNQSVGDAPFLLGVAKITSKESEHKYRAKFRYIDTATDEPKDLETVFDLNAKLYEDPPSFEVGDTVAAYYDQKLRACVPIGSSGDKDSGGVAAVYTFRGQEGFAVQRVNTGDAETELYTDRALVSLEYFRPVQGWWAYQPELSLAGDTSGCLPLLINLRQNDAFRLTCGTDIYSTARQVIFEHGVRFTILGKVTSTSAVTPATRTSHPGMRMLPGMVNTVSQRSGNSPLLKVIDGIIYVDVPDAGDEWLALVEFWADCNQANFAPVFVRVDGGRGGGSPGAPAAASGSLDRANNSGLFSGTVMDWFEGGGPSAGFPCWIMFVDRLTANDGDVIAEVGRFYGPCQRAGTATFNGQKLPLFLAELGEETYLAKPTTAIAKGESGSLPLYSRGEQPANIIVSAKALGAEVAANKWCIVKKLNGVMYAWPWECPDPPEDE